MWVYSIWCSLIHCQSQWKTLGEKRTEILFWLRCMKCPVKDGCTTLILNSTPTLPAKMRSHYNQAVWCGKYFILFSKYLLSIDEMILSKIRVIVPPKLRPLARSYIWWPGIDKEIELTVKSCSGCQLTQKVPGTVPLHPWEWPTKFCKQKCYFWLFSIPLMTRWHIKWYYCAKKAPEQYPANRKRSS